MSSEERPALLTLPTELERADAFYYVAAPLAIGVLGWYLAQFGISLWWITVPMLIVGAWMLTGEPVTDVAVIGAVATWLRGKLGLRQAHEWLAAFAHYWRLAIWPVWKAQCKASYLSVQRRITQWQAQFSAWTTSKVSAASLWGSRIRSNSSDALEP